MFTRDSKILSHRLTTPLTSVSNAVGDVFKPITLNQIIKSLFANNEQGFVYDPNDLTTMFQDAAGTVPVTAAGQPVGLMLDKSKGASLGPNLHKDSETVFIGGSSRISAGVYRAYSATGELSQITQSLPPALTGRYVEVTVNIESLSGQLSTDFGNSPTWNTTGVKKFFGRLLSVGIVFKRAFGSGVDAIIRDISVREVFGNHAYQTTSSMRPLLVASPQRLDYDIADDNLITGLPAQLTGCTVVRAVPNVGTQILTGQTVPATYEDNTDHCGLIVINRALTPSETSAITAEFNKRAGV